MPAPSGKRFPIGLPCRQSLPCVVAIVLCFGIASSPHAQAAKWLTMRRWFEAKPGDELAKEVRAKQTSEPERYFAYTHDIVAGKKAKMT